MPNTLVRGLHRLLSWGLGQDGHAQQQSHPCLMPHSFKGLPFISLRHLKQMHPVTLALFHPASGGELCSEAAPATTHIMRSRRIGLWKTAARIPWKAAAPPLAVALALQAPVDSSQSPLHILHYGIPSKAASCRGSALLSRPPTPVQDGPHAEDFQATS